MSPTIGTPRGAADVEGTSRRRRTRSVAGSEGDVVAAVYGTVGIVQRSVDPAQVASADTIARSPRPSS